MLKYRDANDPVSFRFWKGVPHMNEKHMQYVLTVLKEGSFTNAAKKLYVSQPSLSQIIKTAESNLGAPIFNRSTDPITLTPAGQLYVEAARQVTTISTNLVNSVMRNSERSVLVSLFSAAWSFYRNYIRVLKNDSPMWRSSFTSRGPRRWKKVFWRGRSESHS